MTVCCLPLELGSGKPKKIKALCVLLSVPWMIIVGIPVLFCIIFPVLIVCVIMEYVRYG